MDWKARWIWDGSGKHPRNHWVCFRKEFDVVDVYDEVKLHVTADSRYILYVNGKKTGFGPVRCWTFEQSYDTYDLTDLLIDGKNCIALLVVHFGVSTFQYVEGRGGLLTQVEFLKDGMLVRTEMTDETWKSRIHEGYLKNMMKISVQQAWTEVFDATRFDAGWINSGYDDNKWDNSSIIGDCGIEPWNTLIPRDIPFLACEQVYPERVESCKEVLPVKNSICINLRNALFNDVYDANPREFTACILLDIYSEIDVNGYIIFPFSEIQSPRGNFRINGRSYILKAKEMTDGVAGDDNRLKIALDKGHNLFVMDIGGFYYEYNVMMAFDFANKLEFEAFEGFQGCRCLVIGPFDIVEKCDTGFARSRKVDYEDETYRKCCSINSFKDVSRFMKYIKPLNDDLILENTAFVLSNVKKTIFDRQVAVEIQNIVKANDSCTVVNPIQSGDLELIIDFGKELTGFIGFDIDAAENTIFDFYLFEYMNNGVIEYTKELDNTLRYISVKGRQKYESVVRRGFRYAMLTIRNLEKPCRIYSVYAILSTFPVAGIGRFECSDYKLNRIWEVSKYTTRLCMEDTFVDCPAYEQTFWVGDSRNEALVNYYTFGSYDLVKRCLGLVSKSSQVTGFLMDQVPSGWLHIIPDWTFFWIMACREYYEYSGDIGFLKKIYPDLLKVLIEYGKMINKQDLFEFSGCNILDWAPMDIPDCGVVTHQNAALVKALADTAGIAEVLGDTDEEQRLKTQAEKIKRAINLHLWSEEKKAFIDSIHEDGVKSSIISQQTNTLIYLYDCFSKERHKDLTDMLIHCPEGYVSIGSPFMSFFHIEALAKMGRVDKAVDYIKQWWGMMLDHGATTCWETFPGYEKNRLTRSHCHAWSAAPGFFLGAYILGVRFSGAGCRNVIIEPNICGLDWASGSVPVPDGRIDIKWVKTNNKMELIIKAPEAYKIKFNIDREKWGIDEVWVNNTKVED